MEGETIGEGHKHVSSDFSPKKYEVKIKKKSPWMISTVVFAVIAVVLLVFMFMGGGITGNVISEEDLGELALNFFNTQLSREAGELISVDQESGVYKVLVYVQEQEVPLYFTKDGKWIGQGSALFSITDQATQPTPSQQQPPQDVPKSDKPEVELFVMTHCPYGTQAEKGFIPAIELLGDKIDASVKFVHYFLHDPEETETPVQICIREEQGDKYLDYLKCFLEDGDTDRCLTKIKIDESKLDSCIENKYEDLYATDSELSEGYGVRGSPTLVVNGQIISSGRSAEAYLTTICSAFNNAPAECEETLDSATPGPGFGYDTTGTASGGGQC
jgi:protein-disulfide isomerase